MTSHRRRVTSQSTGMCADVTRFVKTSSFLPSVHSAPCWPVVWLSDNLSYWRRPSSARSFPSSSGQLGVDTDPATGHSRSSANPDMRGTLSSRYYADVIMKDVKLPAACAFCSSIDPRQTRRTAVVAEWIRLSRPLSKALLYFPADVTACRQRL